MGKGRWYCGWHTGRYKWDCAHCMRERRMVEGSLAIATVIAVAIVAILALTS